MGGHQVSGQVPGDDGFDEDGYDESQRAEILEATRDGPSDGTILTDLAPDLGESDEEDEDELAMADDELGAEDDDTVGTAGGDQAEDELQEDFEDDNLAEDGDLDDADRTAIEP
ncbi:DNA primase [Sphingomonas sp. CFBP 13720]|uniref:DNA primase n=1 Tax=Sphingomonas sp. CFBP 13720 TaxID=2775302 RepID=UPI00177E4B51|nr:DNA primase [Sphingomonas sp. CFBP 13720]MBD8678296.1 DNA primase [Sphingomonas sp. CFBP 13720]